jgi:hypothetical protein
MDGMPFLEAMDGLGVIGTLGFFVPAALLIAVVVGAVVRDRRLHARQAEQGDGDSAHTREAPPHPPPGSTPPRAD